MNRLRANTLALRQMLENDSSVPSWVTNAFPILMGGHAEGGAIPKRVADWLAANVDNPTYKGMLTRWRGPAFRGVMLRGTRLLDQWTNGAVSDELSAGVVGGSYDRSFVVPMARGSSWTKSYGVAESYAGEGDGGGPNEYHCILFSSCGDFADFKHGNGSSASDREIVALVDRIRCSGLIWSQGDVSLSDL